MPQPKGTHAPLLTAHLPKLVTWLLLLQKASEGPISESNDQWD